MVCGQIKGWQVTEVEKLHQRPSGPGHTTLGLGPSEPSGAIVRPACGRNSAQGHLPPNLLGISCLPSSASSLAPLLGAVEDCTIPVPNECLFLPGKRRLV